MNRKPLIVLTLTAVALGIATWLHFYLPHSALRTPHSTLRWPVMGTVAQVTIRHSSLRTPHSSIRTTYAEVEDKLSAWNPNSELCRLTAAGQTNWLETASPAMRPCYAAALRLARESGNAFNPAIGRHLRSLGVGNGRYCDFDLGAIAKGFAVDLAASRLPPDVPPLLLDLGGNLRVVGQSSWRTGIRNPFAAGEYCAVITLTNGESIATSGNYERFIEKDGRRLSHILDGRTAQPISGIAAVTVVTPPAYGAMLADGLSTTLFVLGPEAGRKFLNTYYPLALALWIPDTPESPRIIATPAMSQRLSQIIWTKNQD